MVPCRAGDRAGMHHADDRTGHEIGAGQGQHARGTDTTSGRTTRTPVMSPLSLRRRARRPAVRAGHPGRRRPFRRRRRKRRP
ncbi:protein of unknown function [Blastococcus saxobsidens DD2]|uniref:Uncharacterized protein n=1 Tax=Blastococcus saxobsidens (strain DD2) TaxID=1146883 RepID=H6RR14_BLASD|nr:protein of unknown function [Blastococcus saxobsidens DD2]